MKTLITLLATTLLLSVSFWRTIEDVKILNSGDTIQKECFMTSTERDATRREISNALEVLRKAGLMEDFNTACDARITDTKQECSWTEWCGDGIVNWTEICDEGENNNSERSSCNNKCELKRPVRPTYTPDAFDPVFSYSYDVLPPVWWYAEWFDYDALYPNFPQ